MNELLTLQEHSAFLQTRHDETSMNIYCDRLKDAGEEEMALLVRERNREQRERMAPSYGREFYLDSDAFIRAYKKLRDRVKLCIPPLTNGRLVLKSDKLMEDWPYPEGVPVRYEARMHCESTKKEWGFGVRTTAKRERSRGMLWVWLEPLAELFPGRYPDRTLDFDVGREGVDLKCQIQFLPCLTTYLEQACQLRRGLVPTPPR